MKNLRDKAFDKVNKKLKVLECRSLINEVNERGGIFTIIDDIYGSLKCDIYDFKAVYESVLSTEISKDNIIDLDGNKIYKEMKYIANYAYQLYFDAKLDKETFFSLLDIQSKRFYNEMDVKNRDWTEWDNIVDFVWWVNAVLKLKIGDED